MLSSARIKWKNSVFNRRYSETKIELHQTIKYLEREAVAEWLKEKINENQKRSQVRLKA